MSRQSNQELKRKLESVEAELGSLGLEAQLLRYFVNDRPARRAELERFGCRDSCDRKTRPGNR